MTCPDTPEWANDVLGESEEYFGNIAYALSHPVETIESMAQSTNDTYEKEGLIYMVSYTVTDFLLGKALSGGGKGSSVRAINPSDNRGSGSSAGHQLRKYPDGTKYKYKIIDE